MDSMWRGNVGDEQMARTKWLQTMQDVGEAQKTNGGEAQISPQ